MRCRHKDVYILGIESSCDETAAAVVKNGRTVLSNVIDSQASLHEKYGGVVPEIASRRHMDALDNTVAEALSQSGVRLSEIDAVAPVYGPGLVGALLTGLSFAKALAFSADKPLVGVHHIEGHICANFLDNEDFHPPFVCLVISGGHTHLVHVRDFGKYEILGKTRDDAVGEAYDKAARSIGLPYPGGAALDALAKSGDPGAIAFPRVTLEEGSLDFSFSGLKSAVLNYLNKAAQKGEDINKANVAASFQQAAADVLVMKSMLACRKVNAAQFALAGGVASNSLIRRALARACEDNGIRFHAPPPVFCTDNAAMAASCGYFAYMSGTRRDMSLNACPSLPIGGS